MTNKRVEWSNWLKYVVEESSEVATMEHIARWLRMIEQAANSYVLFGFHIDGAE